MVIVKQTTISPSFLTLTDSAVKVEPNLFLPSQRYSPSCFFSTCSISNLLLTKTTSTSGRIWLGLIQRIFAGGYESSGHCRLTVFPS